MVKYSLFLMMWTDPQMNIYSLKLDYNSIMIRISSHNVVTFGSDMLSAWQRNNYWYQ